MTKDTILEIVELVSEIGESSKRYVSLTFTTSNNTFAIIIYIMSKGYNGVKDTRYYNSESDWLMHKDWLLGWKAIIETEREDDEAD